jgi:hypothetical protein
VDVSVAASVVGLDEAEAFVGIEELYGSADHYDIPSGGRTDDRPPKC